MKIRRTYVAVPCYLNYFAARKITCYKDTSNAQKFLGPALPTVPLMKKIFLPLSLLLSLTACTNENPAEEVPAVPTSAILKDTAIAQEVKEQPVETYKYEPAVSTLTGVLEEATFYGPPGFGEDTVNDSKEIVPVLILTRPIRVEGADENFNTRQDSVWQIQLFAKSSVKEFYKKEVSVTGTLFGAMTAHHHTAVMIEVSDLKAE